MPGRHILTLQQADQARIDFALIEEHLEFLYGQIARLPSTRVPVQNAAVRRLIMLRRWCRLTHRVRFDVGTYLFQHPNASREREPIVFDDAVQLP
jgi:hypothetical protein